MYIIIMKIGVNYMKLPHFIDNHRLFTDELNLPLCLIVKLILDLVQVKYFLEFFIFIDKKYISIF